MADKLSFDLVSPERLLLSEVAEMVTLPGTEGDLGVLVVGDVDARDTCHSSNPK